MTEHCRFTNTDGYPLAIRRDTIKAVYAVNDKGCVIVTSSDTYSVQDDVHEAIAQVWPDSC